MTVDRDFYREIEDSINQLISGRTPQEQAIIRNKVSKEIAKNVARGYRDKETHLTWVIANTAYLLVLTENLPAKEALIQAAEKYEAEIKEVLEEKSRHNPGLVKSVIKNNSQNDIQKDMRKKGFFNTQSMKNSRNVWQMLNLLSCFRRAYNTIKNLEKADEDLRRELSEVKYNLGVFKNDINRLNKEVAEIKTDIVLQFEERVDSENNPKIKAKMLKDSGFTQKEIAERVGKDVRTIRRWWKEY